MFLGIDLENIVYYRDNTHYFVMTAKKQSLLDKGVIINVSVLPSSACVYSYHTRECLAEVALSCCSFLFCFLQIRRVKMCRGRLGLGR